MLGNPPAAECGVYLQYGPLYAEGGACKAIGENLIFIEKCL